MASATTDSNVSELLARVTRQLGQPIACDSLKPESAPAAVASTESVLLATAARYCPPAGNFALTPPTGFDFEAGTLFEAIVESAFIVANADGTFDELERRAFTEIVLEASGRRVAARQVEAIVLDLTTQFEEDGLLRRLAYLSQTITQHAHRREVLLIAALIAEVSAGVSDDERRVLEQLATAFELPVTAVDESLAQVHQSLGQ